MTQWLERTVRAYPDQWNWMNIRWWANSDNEHASQNQGTQRAV
jgi:lauroyl/myristoyl acyltransferase